MREKQPGAQNTASAHLGASTSSESKVSSDWEKPRGRGDKGWDRSRAEEGYEAEENKRR